VNLRDSQDFVGYKDKTHEIRWVSSARELRYVPILFRRWDGKNMTSAQLDPVAELGQWSPGMQFGTILVDPPWRFTNRTGKMAPEHRRLSRYGTLTANEIAHLPVQRFAAATAHLYLWVPNAMLPDGLSVLEAWGFTYKTNIVWHKLRKDGGSDGRGVGFYFRNVTELLLFGVRGKNARTLAPGRRQVNYMGTRKREHSRKPDEQYDIIESCSPGPYLELFARGARSGWTVWGNQAVEDYKPTWTTYSYNSATAKQIAAE
jgi:N6-adenosine-specific RNA methylase IME4